MRTAAFVLTFATAISNVAMLSAQAPDLAFEVSSVKVNRGGDTRSFYRLPTQGQVALTNVPLRTIIARGYGSN